MTKLYLPRSSVDPVRVRRGPIMVRSPFGDVPGDIPPEYIGDPIHLTASVAGLQPGTQGAGVNVKALKNPGPGPIEVYGFKFRLRCATFPITGAVIGCRLDLGDFPLTNGFIPVYSFGRAENVVLEQSASNGNPPTQTYAEYVVRLSRPIYLPRGAAIRPQLQHRGHTQNAVDVHMSVYGRMLPIDAPLPQSIYLPYWASYTAKTFTLGTADSDASSESELINPFDVPLHIERFVGRMSYFSNSQLAYGAAMTELEQSSFAAVGPFTNTAKAAPQLGDALGQITCSIVDSNGYPVVKRLTPFRLVFDAETRSWPVSHDLPPEGYYLVTMQNAAWLISNPFGTSKVSVQPCVSMLGWREVA